MKYSRRPHLGCWSAGGGGLRPSTSVSGRTRIRSDVEPAEKRGGSWPGRETDPNALCWNSHGDLVVESDRTDGLVRSIGHGRSGWGGWDGP